MNLTSIARMPVSAEAVWPELGQVGSTVARLFAFLVVPLSLLPPTMIYWAGNRQGDAFVEGFNGKPWLAIAGTFFVCELVSVGFMGWLTRRVARAWGEQVSVRNAYVVTAVAAIPLWVSSLGLLVPSLAFNVALSSLALLVSCALVFQGVRSFCQIDEERIEQAFAISQLVFGAGLGVWGFLILLLIV